VMAFGVGFISIMFLGFASGFGVARFWLGKSFDDSCIISLVFGISTLMVEAVLMIFRLTKWE
jgi:hypothetical protein